MKIGILGAGVMGTDIAMVCAAAGMEVTLKDIDANKLEKSQLNGVRKFRSYRLLNANLKKHKGKDLCDSIHYTIDYADLSDVDWIIENVPEDVVLKQAVYRELQEVCRPETLYGMNTSCISITKIASVMPDPSRVIGMHFMNPVPVKRAVEVIRGFHTSEETINQAQSLLKKLHKQSILVNDYPGFVANRLSHLFMNEAAFLVQDDVAEPQAIDAIFQQGYGHSMGPLATADLIGLDTVVSSLKVLCDSYQDPKFRCCPLLQKMVDAGELGCKSGKGFYEYQDQ